MTWPGINPARLAQITAAAAARDRQGASLAEEIGWLHADGALVAALPESLAGSPGWPDRPQDVAAVMAQLGTASLPLARLFEGHVNAGQLIGLYGAPALKSAAITLVRQGGLLGVWGADAAAPVVARRHGNDLVLTGGKSFCSGLGLVGLALVSAACDGATLLVAIDATDPKRMDHDQWCVTGMRATASGGYDATGLVISRDRVLGGPGDYYREPHFLGGMYRMCAVQLGGLDALIAAFVDQSRCRGGGDDALRHYRMGEMLAERRLAWAATTLLASAIADQGPPGAIAHDAVLTREGVERCIVTVLTIIGRAAGTSLHREGSALSRIARDLSFYLRQGAIDERLTAIGRARIDAPSGQSGACR